MASATIAADLAADAAACADVVAASVARQAAAAALRAHLADDPTLLAHVECLAGGMEKHAQNLNTPGPGGATPLLVACLQGDAAVAEALVEAGADPTAEGEAWDLETEQEDEENAAKWKYFPLSLAAREGHIAIAELLLARKGVNVNQAGSDVGATALFLSLIHI